MRHGGVKYGNAICYTECPEKPGRFSEAPQGPISSLSIIVHRRAAEDAKRMHIFLSAERAESDIDVMVIGGISLEGVFALIRGPEEILSREKNVSLYDLQEIQRRVKENDPFIREALGGSKIMLIGEEDELRRAIA